MGDIITALQATSVPAILVVGGIVFLFLAVVGQFVGQISVPPERQKWAGIIGVLLLFSGVGLYVVPGSPSVPTPTIVAGVTPNTPTATPIPPTTPAVEKPTNTAAPEPPTNTPVPKPTDTPTPTNTPRAILMPTATIDTDPTVYDNFNNPADEGSYNKGLWEPWGWWGQDGQFAYQVAQQNGVLIVTQESEEPSGCIRLAAYRKRFSTLSAPTFFEARIMVSPDKFDGNMGLFLWADLPGGEGWVSNCGIGGYDGAYCNDTAWPEQEGHSYDVGSKPVDLGTWHTFRIEVDPATMTFTYYIDGQMVDSHVPVDAEKLKKARFTLVIGVCEKKITGYIDDVRIGQFGQ